MLECVANLGHHPHRQVLFNEIFNGSNLVFFQTNLNVAPVRKTSQLVELLLEVDFVSFVQLEVCQVSLKCGPILAYLIHACV